MNPTTEPTPTQAGLHLELFPSPFVSPTSPLSATPKMSASPRPRMPAGPRVRKNTAGAVLLNAQSSATPLNFTDYPPVPVIDRNSPTSSTADADQSASLPPQYPPPLSPDEKAVQSESNDPIPSSPPTSAPTPTPSQSLTTPESTRPSTPASANTYRVINKPATFPIPAPVNFNTDPIAFKGLPLEAAQWSFTSDQLREMVSRAIRDSAKEQFVRLLSLDALDKEIPEELARLESLKFTTQAQYRFHFQRRTNLLQSLNALAYSTPAPAENGTNTLGLLIQQLAEVTANMDRFTETLLQASEHRSQLAQVQEKHVSSALAVALRKLNASYAKRTTDLKTARSRIATLQAELEEAWKVAEGIAEEIDDLDNFKSDYAMEDRFEDGEGSIQDDDPTIISVVNARVIPVTGTAVASKATLVGTPPPEGDNKFPVPQNSHPRCSHSTNGSTGERSSRITAAKKRISLISQSATKIQRHTQEGDGGGEPGGPTTPKSNRRRARSQSKGNDSVSASPSLLSNPSNTSFLELSRPVTPLPSDEEAMSPFPALVRVQQTDGNAGTTMGIRVNVKQIDEDHQANLDYSPGFSAAFDSAMIPPPPPDNVPSPLTRTSSVNLPHPPYTQDTRRIRSMQPSISVSSSLRDLDSEDSDHTGNDQDSPVVPVLRIPQSAEEAHIVPLPGAEEDDKKLSTSHHSYDKSDLWPWSKRNTAILADVVDEPPPSSALPSADEEVDPDSAAGVEPSSCISMNITVETSDNDRASASYLPDMTTPSSGSTNGTESTDPPVSIIASEDSEENNDGHERQCESENGVTKGGVEGRVPPSPAPSEVPEMPIFPTGMKSTISLERNGSIGSAVARKSSLFRSHRGNTSNNKRSSMPLPSAVIASLLPWRGSRRPSSEPELPSQCTRSRSRLSSSLPSPH